jgi:hypothetical protein
MDPKIFREIPKIPTADEIAASAVEFESQQAAEESALLRQMEASGSLPDDVNAEANPFDRPGVVTPIPAAAPATVNVRLKPIRRETIDMAFDLLMKLRTVSQGTMIEIKQGAVILSGSVDKAGSIHSVWKGIMEIV